MDMLAGAFGGNVEVFQTIVSGDGASDVSGALEVAMQEFEAAHPETTPTAASIYASDGKYAVVVMFEPSSNG